MKTITYDETKCRLVLRDPDETMRAAGGAALEHADNPSTWDDANDVFIAMLAAAPKPPAVELLPQSSAPPALYQHDDGRYALAIGDVARHRLTHGEPGWHRVPLDVVVTNTGIEE